MHGTDARKAPTDLPAPTPELGQQSYSPGKSDITIYTEDCPSESSHKPMFIVLLRPHNIVYLIAHIQSLQSPASLMSILYELKSSTINHTLCGQPHRNHINYLMGIHKHLCEKDIPIRHNFLKTEIFSVEGQR